MRRAVDLLYKASGLAGAATLFVLLLLVLAQMVARWIEVPVTGLTEIAGYCMAATSFFGLGYAFSRDAHIRVNLIVGPPDTGPRYPQVISVLVALVLAGLLAFYATRTTWLSYRFNEVSQGQDAIPLWIPQTVMSIGSIVLFVAVADRLLRLSSRSRQSVDQSRPQG